MEPFGTIAPPTAIATLTGSARNPSLMLSFPPTARHPQIASLSLMDWVRNLPDARFNPEAGMWEVTGTGQRPSEMFTRAGFVVGGFDAGEFVGVTNLDALVCPVAMMSDDGRTVLVRHRLTGFVECRERIGPAAAWDKTRRLFRMPVNDVLIAGIPRPGVVWDPSAIEKAYQIAATHPVVAGLEVAAARLGSAVDRTTVEDDIQTVAERVGHYPETWGMPPMAHQVPGALAVAAGHTLLVDAPGVGKTNTALLAAAITGADKLFITCPPVVSTHWAREVARTGLAPEQQIVVVRAGKRPTPFTDAKVVIAADSMLASRPALAAQVALWGPQWLLIDEAHRFKSATAKRTDALLELKAMLPDARCVAITGTPVMSGPHELVPLLELTGHLSPVFGGSSAFLTRYCRQDKFGTWHPNKRTQQELHNKLARHVWVRRTKEQVLPHLPEVTVTRIEMTLDLADYRRTHADILERIDEWITKSTTATGFLPGDDEQDAFVDTAIQFASWLRRAAGMTKVSVVAEMVRDHLAATTENGNSTRPILIWAHHSDVIAALQEALPGTPAIRGGTPKKETDRLIDDFQAGQIPALICSITAVGAGVTLTRGSDAIFAEMDWTPAMMQQAVDRQRRIGQRNAITVRIPVALGTLDEHISRVLTDKALTVGAVLGDADAEQFASETDRQKTSPATLLRAMLSERIEVRQRNR